MIMSFRKVLSRFTFFVFLLLGKALSGSVPLGFYGVPEFCYRVGPMHCCIYILVKVETTFLLINKESLYVKLLT